MTCSASATPAVKIATVRAGIDPYWVTASRDEGPGTVAVASHGGVAAGSAPSTCAV